MLSRIYHIILTVRSHQGFMRYFSNTVWIFSDQILRIFAGLLVGIWVARYLGPEQFGLLSYVVAFVAIFGSFAKLGLDGIVVRALVNEPDKREVYLGTAFWLKLAGAVMTLIVIGAVTIFTANDDTENFYILIIASGFIFQSFEVIDFYFQSKVLSKFVSICKMTQLLLSSLLKIYFVLTKSDIFWFVLVSTIDQISLALALIYAYSRQSLDVFYFKFDKHVAKELLINARPLILAGIMVSIYSSIDRLIIKEMLGVKEVGFYTVGSGLTTSLYFIPTLIASSMFPAILNAKNQSIDLYNKRLSHLYKYTLSIGLFICILVSIFASSIIHILYGYQYAESVQVLQIYIWILLVVCFSSVFGKWILSEKLQYLMPRFTFMAIVVNIVACFIFIPIWSIKGAAFAALASQLIPFIWFGINNKEIRSQINCALKIKFNYN